MAADEALARRVRAVLEPRDDVTERRMFGGLGVMVGGHMLCAVGADHLTVRVGRDQHEEALARAHAEEMRFTGRPMAGFVTVGPPGYASDADLEEWLSMALGFVTTLPPK